MTQLTNNPFDHVDSPLSTIMNGPFNRIPIFSTMGRGPRGEKGDGIVAISSSEFPPNGSYTYGTLLSVTDTGELYMFVESNEWKQI